MFIKVILLSILGGICTPIGGDKRNKFPLGSHANPPFEFADCLYRYFSCSDDHTYGKWPMNSRICYRDYQFCLAEAKWNQGVISHNGVTITYPLENPTYNTEISTIGHYLFNFAFHERICSYKKENLSCGPFGNIHIIFVFFGRVEGNDCPTILPSEFSHKSCEVENAFEYVYKRCDGKKKCSISPKELDPKHCKGMYPYLEMKYTCSGFERPSVSSSGGYNSSFNFGAVVDQDISTSYSTNIQTQPWIQLGFSYNFEVQQVLVFANKDPDYVHISTIEVQLTNGQVINRPPFYESTNNCIKNAPWDLTFQCNSYTENNGLIIYSTDNGAMSIKEVTIIIENPFKDDVNTGDGGSSVEMPNQNTEKNIYVIIDKACAKDQVSLSCYNYGGNVIVIEFITGRTKGGMCNSEMPIIECSKTFNEMLPSCMDYQACLPTYDRTFMSIVNKMNRESDCNRVNYYEFHYACDGLPQPQITASSVDNGFSLDFLFYEDHSPDSYYSSKKEDSPWIHLVFGQHLAVQGVQFTLTYVKDPEALFQNIEVRVGKHNVTSSSEIEGNPICGRYNGPPYPDQKHVVITCGMNGEFVVGKHMTIQKLGYGVLQIRDIVVLLKPEVALSYVYR
ncbi:uncharacterized protein [Lepeophtheirus salmonis]|uniref:uncharacterized protein n=1 Tax=Lepeophtheirus salmonis TaxID=72036 RepID=UPI001AE4F1D2|nr:uncharacterized protein LOC121116467 [Lepeophtheirus salmonis]